MRLAIVRTSAAPLNLNKYNIQETGLGKQLIRKGVTVDLYSSFSGIKKPVIHDQFKGSVLKLIPIKGIVLKQITFYPGLIRQLMKGNYQVIQVHEDSQFMNSMILSKARKAGIKTILYQGMYENYHGAGGIYQKILDRFWLKNTRRNTDLIFAKTTAARAYLEQKGYNRVQILPVGLDYSKEIVPFTRQDEIDRFKNQFRYVFLYVGVLERRRNIRFLLAVIRELLTLRGEKSIGFISIGNGPDKSLLDKTVAQLKLEPNVLLLDAVPNNQIGNIYKSCDLFLLPSRYEIYGMVVMEALYHGLPVISSCTAGPKDILKEKYQGITLKMEQEKWVTYINDYLDSDYISPSYQSQRRRYITDHYSWERISEKYLNEVEAIK